MKHNLRMAFLSLLLVLTLGVMPVFAESADHAMDWTHGIGSRYRTDVTSALPFEDELFFISGSQLLRVDDPEYEPEVVCNLEDIIWSEALKQSGYYGQVMLLNGGAELVLFSANEGRLYSFVPPTDDTMVRMQMVTELDYSTVPQMGWKKFPIAKDLYDVTVEQAVYDAQYGLYVIAKDKTDEYQIVWFDLDTGKGEMLEFALEDDENSHLLTDMPGIFQWSGTSSKYERTLYDGKVLTTRRCTSCMTIRCGSWSTTRKTASSANRAALTSCLSSPRTPCAASTGAASTSSRRTTGCTSATRATKRQEPTSMARLNNIPL